MNLEVASGRKCFPASRADVFLWSLARGRDRDSRRGDNRNRIVIVVAGGCINDRSRANWLFGKERFR